MKISKNIIITVIILLLGGVGSIILMNLNNGINNKVDTNKININLNNLNKKFDYFIEIHKNQNIALNNRLDMLSDSINSYKRNNDRDHKLLNNSINQIIYIEKKTNKQFYGMYNMLNLTSK